MMLSYKQKKLEKNYELYISKIVENQDAINARLEKLEEEKKKEIQSNYFGLIADYASQEKQQEKMNYIVNGFINVTGNVLSQEDTILMYYDTLEQLTILDLRVLRLYIACDEDVQTIMEDYKLDYSQLGMIKEKLSRLGLLESKNDLDMDENMRNVAQYLEDVTKGKKNPELKRLKRISKFESYRLTSYGEKLYQFFLGLLIQKEFLNTA